MSICKPLRTLFMRVTDFTHGFQGKPKEKVVDFYKLWALFYDFSVKLDQAYPREMKKMIDLVVKKTILYLMLDAELVLE